MKFTISNFLAYTKPVTIDLKKINLFIGGNNCGKSTFGKFIRLFQESEINEYEVKNEFSLRNYKERFPQIRTFNDLKNDAKSPILVDLEFSYLNFHIKIQMELDQNETSFIDSFLLCKSGHGWINFVEINDCCLFERKSNNGFLFKDGWVILGELLSEIKLQKPEVDWIRQEKLYLFDMNTVVFDQSGFKGQELLDMFVNYYSVIGYALHFMLKLTQKKISTFYIDDPVKRKTIPDAFEDSRLNFTLKKDFDIEFGVNSAVELDAFKDNLSQEVNRRLVVKYQGRSHYFESMGSGFQNLFRIMLSASSAQFDAFVGFEEYMPIFEEPEIGLHPDWLLKLFNLLRSKAVIETHSVVLLRALQLEVAEGNYRSDEVMIHNFYRDENQEVSIKQIQISKSGILSDDFESGFQDDLLVIEDKLWQIQQRIINRN